MEDASHGGRFLRTREMRSTKSQEIANAVDISLSVISQVGLYLLEESLCLLVTTIERSTAKAN